MTKKTTKKVTRRYKVLVNSKDGKFVKGRSYAESTILRANEMAIQRQVGFDKSKFEEEKKNFIKFMVKNKILEPIKNDKK